MDKGTITIVVKVEKLSDALSIVDKVSIDKETLVGPVIVEGPLLAT